MRIMSVIGALALTCLCLASPTIAASPADHVTFDVVGHELIVPASAALDADGLAFTAATHDVDFVLASTTAADEADGYCSDLSDYVLRDCLDRLFDGGSTTSRHYDPGWPRA